MKNEDAPRSKSEEFEHALQNREEACYVLRLYIAGNTTKSANAILNLKEICEQRLKGRYRLEVIDIYQQPDAARTEQIIATPTLIKTLPAPMRRIIGDLSKTERILIGLDLKKLEK